MTPLKAARTIRFRLTALYAGLFLLSLALLFALVYWRTAANLEDGLRQSIATEMSSFETRAATEPAHELADEVDERLQTEGVQPYFYALRDPAGRFAAGNLPDTERFSGWRQLPRGGGGRLLANGKTLPGGYHLVIAEDMGRTSEAKTSILRSFLWSSGAGLLLAVVGGVFLSGGFLRRISEINATADAIMTGHLGSRIPIRGTGDEIDQLSEKLNQMLDRLYDVMEGLRQVSTDIAHDLRTPLSRLKQELEAVRAGAASTGDYERAVDRALAEADEALALFAALLRIAQIESGSRRTHFADVDLSALLMTLAEVYGPVAEEADHALRAAVEPGIHVVGDAELLTQMFVNLIENALRHTPASSVVEITLARGPGCARAEISDNGPGIPAAHRLNVLKRFYRLDASRTTPGHGLGLALVSAIAHLHEARLSLADNGPGLNAVLIFDVSNGQPAPSEIRAKQDMAGL